MLLALLVPNLVVIGVFAWFRAREPRRWVRRGQEIVIGGAAGMSAALAAGADAATTYGIGVLLMLTGFIVAMGATLVDDARRLKR